MPRVSIVVDQALLTQAVQTVEANGPLGNLNTLHNKVAEIYNSGTVPAPITFSVVALRIKEFGIVTQTTTGKRGRAAGQAMTAEHKQKLLEGRQNTPRKARSEKFKGNPKIVAGFVEMRKNFRELANGGDKFEGMITRIEKGSTKAALAANCYQCMGGSGRDAKNCQEACCPFFALTCSIFKRGQKPAETEEDVVLDDDSVGEAA